MPSNDRITFEILWYAGGPDYAPNRVIGRDRIERHDLTDAITAACNMLKAGKGAHGGYAHGFYVRKAAVCNCDMSYGHSVNCPNF